MQSSHAEAPSVPIPAPSSGAASNVARPRASEARGPLPSAPGLDARRLGERLRMTPTVAEWLLRSGHGDSDATRRFLEPKLAHLSQPEGMADRAVAAERLANAIRRGEKIAVFGDYDCDGITSTAIATEMLRALGGDIVPLLANRFDGGYGVSKPAVERILGTGAAVLVTCDCGSSDHETLGAIAARGLDTVVIDHHLVPEKPLPALAFLNPHRPDCGFAYKGLASCGLALSLGAAVRAALGKELDVRPWLDLVAVGTIADVAPLDGDNRALVRAGLLRLRSAPRPGLRAIAELAKIDGESPVSARDVAFRIAPRINAPGRLGAPDLALELLLAQTEDAARALAATVETISDQRRALSDGIGKEAAQEIEETGYAERPAIVVGREGWNAGVVGIVAGRLADRYAKPIAVVGFESGVGRGSVRGPKGARLHDALVATSACLERFGGHQAAAGFEIRADRLAEFRSRFEEAVASLHEGVVAEAREDAVRLAPGDDPSRVLLDLERLEPCGNGNPAPRLVVEGRVREAREVRGGHLKLDLVVDGDHRIGCFGVGMGASAPAVGGSVVLVGEMRRDTYRGGDAVEILVERLV